MFRHLVFLLFFSIYSTSFPQTSPSFSFSHLTTLDGLSQSTVIAIHQDRIGQIWIGTRDGLNKYDGTKFTIYRNVEGNPKSISNNDILSIEEDREGFLWIGTYNGLNKYNPKTDEFERLFHNEKKTSLVDNTIWTIRTLSTGEIWAGTSGGLSIYNNKTNTFTTFLDTASRPIEKQVISILESSDGNIFVGTGAGVYKVSGSQESRNFKLIEGTEKLYVQDLQEDSNGDILIATRSKSVLKYDRNQQTIVPYLKVDTKDLNSNNVRQLLFDDKMNLWVGTYNGLKIVDKNMSVTTIKADVDKTNALSKNSVKCLFKDGKGSIWVGTYYGGVNIWDETNVNFKKITQNRKGKGLNYSVVSSIEKFEDRFFFGTEGGGVNIWDKNQNTYQYLTRSNSKLSDDNIKALHVEGDKLWIGTFKSGLNIYSLKLKRFINESLPSTLMQLTENTGVYAIVTDVSSNIWIGTFGKGLFKFNLKSKDFQKYANLGEGASLSSNLVRTICADLNNNIWVGTEKGLNKIDDQGHISTYFYDKNLQYGDDIPCVYEDRSKNLWVGTKSKGLFKYDGTAFSPISLRPGEIKISTVHSILEGEDNHLWISTNQGLIEYDYKQKTTQIYNQTDGLITNEFNNNSSFRTDDSQLYFGGPLGVSYFNPKTLTKNTYAPQVILTDFTVRENDVSPNSSGTVLENAMPYTKSVNLSHSQGNFSISFSIPNFINSSNNKYRYRLKGLEKDWNLTTSNTASYTIQNPGNYTFEVKGANNDNVWNIDTTSLDIYVAPAPWRTWWAFTLYGLLIFGALYFLLNILKSRTKLKNDLQLEHLETERTKEINKTKLDFFTNISHEFRTPLALILGPLKQIIEDYQGSSKMYKKLLVIENNASHLLQLINRLMDFRKFESHLYKLEAAEGNIVKFLKEIFLSFTENAENEDYNFEFICDEEEILVYYDRYKLERVFFNLISNAFRYTPSGGDITVRVKKSTENVTISVEDSGVGIAKEYQDKIFERFFEVAVNNKPDRDYNKGTGIGLSIAKSIVELHKGRIVVCENVKNGGSIFSVILRIGNAHLEASEILKNFKFSDDVSQYVNQIKDVTPAIHDELELTADSQKSTILLVEDNKQLRKFIRDLLISNYNIIEAENGKVALKKAKNKLPDLIVSDVIMPEMTGTELCSALKGGLKTSHIPVILLTSRSSLIYKVDGLEHGADDYISKPFDINEFKLRIKNLLKARETLQQKFASNDRLEPNDILLSSYDETLYKKALQIVNENIGNEDFDITFFCSELGVSRTMLFTKIKAWSNFTPNEFIVHFRMKRAAQLLEQGKVNISQVSYKVGYKDPKYFSKSFQKKFGETPSKYAEKFSE
ncbi:hybrid sensor histidine kinase/response regulator [Hyunsoonleella flava]|uniref:histidine kinase n=1 Tax=Hyunsoonleella flava TaxID=2527939 RepID=A0A4Q9FJ05_9FLAO|nr:two-component regulator propeller domain-containing protein [Hyunsoonleella flava]TBN03667.1 hybrid sensor histidine kinase/response regulator [Hyunsoonleella flava]